VVLRILQALVAGASAGLVHCDVRPSNMVWAGGGAVLVDWGSSVPLGAGARGRGVAAFADARVFAGGAFKARPAQDAAGALYTWLAIAFDAGCAAPWGAEGGALRALWIREMAALDARAAAVAAALALAEAAAEGGDAGAALASARRALEDDGHGG
jgi:hypothetical protein